jgi:transcriptional regulator with XRE-family HTH domain
MISLKTPANAQKTIADSLKQKRLALGFTQEGLANRSGVPLPTLRKFERNGLISFESFLKLLLPLELLDAFVQATESQMTEFQSIYEVERLAQQEKNGKNLRKRGWIK